MAERTIIRDLFFGFIVFTLFIVAGVSMMGIFNDSDADYTSDEKFTEFNRSMNKLNEVTERVDTLSSGIEPKEQDDFSILGVLGTLIGGAWNALTVLVGGLGFMTDAFTGLTTTFGVPAWIIGLISLIITALLIFVLYSALFQRDL